MTEQKGQAVHPSQNRSKSPSLQKESDRILLPGKPDFERCDNRVISARYTALSFFPMVRTCYMLSTTEFPHLRNRLSHLDCLLAFPT